MKKGPIILLSSLLLLAVPNTSFSQDLPDRQDKLYTMSGFGFSIPTGESSHFMGPKFSTSIGLNLGLGNGGLFLYPKLNLHAFSYDNTVKDANSNYELKEGRATTYLLNIALGYRKIVNKFAFYGFVGGGGGLVLTPRILVDPGSNIATLSEKSNRLIVVEPGVGIEYNIGGVSLFAESSFMHGIGKVDDNSYNSIPLTIGIKPNLSKLLRKKK